MNSIFCTVFNTYEEAMQNLSTQKCKGCENLVYEDGLMTCKKMQEKLLKGDENK